jgi:hypothetical protein
MKGANQIYLEYRLGAVTKNQIVDWAAGILTSTDPIANFPEIIALTELKGIDSDFWKICPETLLRQIVRKYFLDFKVPNVESETFARECLREECAEILKGTPLDLRFFAVVANIHRLFNNPEWLGKLSVLIHQNTFFSSEESFYLAIKEEIKTRLTEL